MARRKVVNRRPSTGARRTVTATVTQGSVDLDDRPLTITPARDGKRLLVTLPYEVTVVDARTLQVERSIPMKNAAP